MRPHGLAATDLARPSATPIIVPIGETGAAAAGYGLSPDAGQRAPTEIVKRFCTGAMSFDSISKEALPTQLPDPPQPAGPSSPRAAALRSFTGGIHMTLRTRAAWRIRRTHVTPLLVLAGVAGACGTEQPAEPFHAPVTLWITPGAYHLGTADSEPLSVEELPAALEAALGSSVTPSVLTVRTVGDEALGYDFIMARNAACEAGVRRLEYDVVIPPGSAGTSGEAGRAQGTERVEPPCVAGSQQPDSSAVDVVARADPGSWR